MTLPNPIAEEPDVTDAPALDYPVAAPEGVEPIIFRAQLIQLLAMTYKRAVPDLSDEEANEAALATWGTDWPDDPQPRALEAAVEAATEDLAYWGED